MCDSRKCLAYQEMSLENGDPFLRIDVSMYERSEVVEKIHSTAKDLFL